MCNYHPDPQINAEVEAEAIEGECFDMAAGLPPSWWTCPECGKFHNRGFSGTVGNHRCLNCGYTGQGGVMTHKKPISA